MSAVTVEEANAIHPAQARMSPPSRFADKAFYWLTLSMAFAVVLLVILIGWELGQGSWQAVQKFGFRFVTTSAWDPVAEQYGALPFIYGTAISSLIALLIAVPLSIATAVYLTELAPLWIRQPIVSLIEMLAAIPSVILGLWGIFVMIPWLRDHPFPFLQRILGWTPFFSGPIYGPCMPRGTGANEPWEYIYLASLIKQHIGELFPGLILDGVHAFRVTRNSDLYIDDEEAENLLRTIEQELRRTSRGNAVRLEVEIDCPKDFLELLLEFFNLSEADAYKLNGPLTMTHLAPLVANDAFAKLKDRPFQPARDPALPPHGCVVDDAHWYSQRTRKIKTDPILTQMLRVPKNSSIAYGRRKTNRRNVEFPSAHGILKFGEKLFWSHSWTGCKLAFHALRHQQFHEAAADIDDEDSSLHDCSLPGWSQPA